MKTILTLLLASAVAARAFTYSDGYQVVFNPNGTLAGLNVGAHTSDPSTLANGDLWYDSTANALEARINGASVALLHGSSPLPAANLSGSALPAGIVTSSLTQVGTIGTGVWQGTIVNGQWGGSGVNNGANTLTWNGNYTLSGQTGSTLNINTGGTLQNSAFLIGDDAPIDTDAGRVALYGTNGILSANNEVRALIPGTSGWQSMNQAGWVRFEQGWTDPATFQWPTDLGDGAAGVAASQAWVDANYAGTDHTHVSDDITDAVADPDSDDEGKLVKLGTGGTLSAVTQMTVKSATDTGYLLTALGQWNRFVDGWADPALLLWPTDLGDGESGEVATWERTTAELANYQPISGNLTAIGGLATAADKLDYWTGAGTASLTNLSAFARTFLDDADAPTARNTLDLHTDDSPQFTAVNVGHASDTTVSRSSAGILAVEGNIIYHQGGALGTPASGNGSNLTALNAAELTGDIARARINTALSANAAPGVFTTLAGTTGAYSGLQTITQATVNTGVIASTGYSLTGSSAVSMIDLAGTWNTSGNVDAIALNITQTASGASSNLMNLKLGGTSAFRVTKNGDTIAGFGGGTWAGSLNIGATSSINWGSGTNGTLNAVSNGVFRFANAAGTDATRLILGANSATGVALAKSGTTMTAALGDGTAGVTLAVSGKLASTATTPATLAAAATTFAVTSNVATVTGDAGGNTVATITGGVSGMTLTLIFTDANITITDTAANTADTVNLSAAWTSSAADTLTLVYNGTKWFEVARSVN